MPLSPYTIDNYAPDSAPSDVATEVETIILATRLVLPETLLGTYLTDELFTLSVADDSPHIIGAAYLMTMLDYPDGLTQPEKRAHLSYMAVKDEYRGNGYGTVLLRHLIDHVSEAGYRQIRLTPSTRSASLYVRQGFDRNPSGHLAKTFPARSQK